MPFRVKARSLVLRTISTLRLNERALRSAQSDPSRIIVVEMHETLSAYAEQLRRQLEWVATYFAIISPELFARALETGMRSWPEPKPAVLFTFDDGRESNYRVAAPILESFGARGIFFVVTEFIGLEGEAARNYYYSKIDVRNIVPAGPLRDEVWKPMTAHQLADLARRGHWIGNHSFSHTRLAGLSASDLRRQIEESSAEIALWTGNPVHAFAWPYSWDAIDPASWKEITQIHRFCFAPCPGTFRLGIDSPHLIWRKEIESYYPPAEYQFMYSGLVDLIWAGRRRKLKKMLTERA